MTINTAIRASVGAEKSDLIGINLSCLPVCHPAKLPTKFVILSEAKDPSRWAEMLRCAQHDRAVPDLTSTYKEKLCNYTPYLDH
jgi:hypothetical protein